MITLHKKGHTTNLQDLQPPGQGRPALDLTPVTAGHLLRLGKGTEDTLVWPCIESNLQMTTFFVLFFTFFSRGTLQLVFDVFSKRTKAHPKWVTQFPTFSKRVVNIKGRYFYQSSKTFTEGIRVTENKQTIKVTQIAINPQG